MDAKDLSRDSTRAAADEMADQLGLDRPTELGAELMKRTYRQFLASQLPSQEKRGATPVPRIYVDVSSLRAIWIDAAVAIGFLGATGGSAGIDTLVAALAKAVASFKLLTEDEDELVHNVLFISRGHAYTTPVAESEVRASYQDASVSIDDPLESLVGKGVLKRDGESFTLVP